MDMFSALRIWLRIDFRIQTAGYFLLTFGLQSSPGAFAIFPKLSGYDSSNVPMYEIYSWKMVIYDKKK